MNTIVNSEMQNSDDNKVVQAGRGEAFVIVPSMSWPELQARVRHHIERLFGPDATNPRKRRVRRPTQRPRRAKACRTCS